MCAIFLHPPAAPSLILPSSASFPSHDPGSRYPGSTLAASSPLLLEDPRTPFLEHRHLSTQRGPIARRPYDPRSLPRPLRHAAHQLRRIGDPQDQTRVPREPRRSCRELLWSSVGSTLQYLDDPRCVSEAQKGRAVRRSLVSSWDGGSKFSRESPSCKPVRRVLLSRREAAVSRFGSDALERGARLFFCCEGDSWWEVISNRNCERVRNRI